MITENVIPIEEFGVAGIPKDYNMQEFAACTNGLINALQTTRGGLVSTFLLFDNNNQEILASNNIAQVGYNTLNKYWNVTFETPIEGDYIPLLNAHREAKGLFRRSATDLLFCGYRNKKPETMEMIFSYVRPSTPFESGNSLQRNYGDTYIDPPKTLHRRSGTQGGFDYFSMIII